MVELVHLNASGDDEEFLGKADCELENEVKDTDTNTDSDLTKKELWEEFRVFEKDGIGFLSAGDLKQVMAGQG